MLVVSDFNGTLSHGSPVLGLVGWVGENQSRLRKNLYMAKKTARGYPCRGTGKSTVLVSQSPCGLGIIV